MWGVPSSEAVEKGKGLLYQGVGMRKGSRDKDSNSGVWDAGLLAQDYPTLHFQHSGHKVEDGQRGQFREALRGLRQLFKYTTK
jgi:hypothetical protein